MRVGTVEGGIAQYPRKNTALGLPRLRAVIILNRVFAIAAAPPRGEIWMPLLMCLGGLVVPVAGGERRARGISADGPSPRSAAPTAR